MTSNENMNETKKKESEQIYAVSYARVSTNTEKQDPLTQFILNRKWADDHSAKILKEFLDEESGDKEDRDGLTAMMDFIASQPMDQKVTHVLIASVDRMSRSLSLFDSIIGKLSELGCKVVVSAGRNLDSSREQDLKNMRGQAEYAEIMKEMFVLQGKVGVFEYKCDMSMRGDIPPEFDMKRATAYDLLLLASMGWSKKMIANRFKTSSETINKKLKSEEGAYG